MELNVNYQEKIDENFKIIESISRKINSLELLSFLAYFNSLHSKDEYEDYREGRNYFVSEVVANQCLKNEAIDNSNVNDEEKLRYFFEIQEATLNYCSLRTTKDLSDKYVKGDLLNEISSKIELETKTVKNPGHPIHHLQFSKELYKPFNDQIYKSFGFTLSDILLISDGLLEFLTKRLEKQRKQYNNLSNSFTRETIKLKKGKSKQKFIKYNNIDFSDLVKKNEHEIREYYVNFFRIQFLYNIDKSWVFKSEELSEFLNIDIKNVTSLLDSFSIGFNSLPNSSDIFNSENILIKKPLIKNKDSYLLTSVPLLTWCASELFEDFFKKNSKLFGKFTKQKHNFLQITSEKYFQTILPEAKHYSNMFYGSTESRMETDCIIIFNEYLFIVEAKANKLSSKAKSGHNLKVKDQLEDILINSHNQALRVLNYLKEEKEVEFSNKLNQKLNVKISDYKEVYLVSLTLEQFGNIVPIIKNNDNDNFFDKSNFPLVISLYDLAIINDLFETPSLFFKYLDFRNSYLKYSNTYIFEELDLIGYFIKGLGNNILNVLKNREYADVSYFQFTPETDFINNYYFQLQKGFLNVAKPSYFKNKIFKELIIKIDKSNLKHSIETSLYLLSFNPKSIFDFTQKIKKTIDQFKIDKKLHDCSIYTQDEGGIGFTYMIDVDEDNLLKVLENYIKYKKSQSNSKVWIGIGEINNQIMSIIKI
ncbi:hypothetical protein SAMN05443634_10398 [Chishuiella changwenlii]|uniref:Nuclease-related domain-containing protein n=3 Tax=Chishuiella changwenlii TaxID=1434701 RepID=A0A1M6UX26_9FLAO|nr:hypothetical protein [Chishuiella changwenlii]SHK73740.1 hypothetical protein SAMN05443634_10398 [Chishuiella changwenlii]